MIAAQLTGLRQLEIRQIDDVAWPAGERDVLVAVQTVGICGSDVHNYLNGGIGDHKVAYPFIPGHEAAGVVDAVGAAVTRIRPGDRVAIEPAISCGVCDQCRAGRCNTCRRIRFLSAPGELQGCMCARIVIPEENCFPVPASLTLALAAIAEPFSIALYAVKQSIPIGPETRIGILGAGPIGLCTLLAARAAGGHRLYVTDRIPNRREAARVLGAGWTGDPDDASVMAAIQEREPLGLDVVFECCGQQSALDQAVALLKPGGRLMLVGIPDVARVTFDISQLRRHELTLTNVRRQCGCMAEAINMIAGGAVDVAPLITHRMPPSDAKRAFEMVADYRDGVIKAMIVYEGACYA